MAQKISPDDLVPLNAFEGLYPIAVHVAYADATYEHNHFKNLYHPEAQIMWAHKDMAAVILYAALIAQTRHGWTLQMKDCLRPVEAQIKMAAYGYDATYISSPGGGGHPRGMAVDICPLDKNGACIDMGTPYDFFAPDPNENPSARDYAGLPSLIKQNRAALEDVMVTAGEKMGNIIVPLLSEWWDFRFSKETFLRFDPLTESDLAPYQRMIDPDVSGIKSILAGNYPASVMSAIQDVERRVTAAVG